MPGMVKSLLGAFPKGPQENLKIRAALGQVLLMCERRYFYELNPKQAAADAADTLVNFFPAP